MQKQVLFDGRHVKPALLNVPLDAEKGKECAAHPRTICRIAGGFSQSMLLVIIKFLAANSWIR